MDSAIEQAGRQRPLQDLKQDVLALKALELSRRVLGPEVYDLLDSLLLLDDDLLLIKCAVRDAAPGVLEVTGLLEGFPSLGRVPIFLWLMDLTLNPVRPVERHCLFKLELPEVYKFREFLEDFGADPDAAKAVQDGTAQGGSTLALRSANFDGRALVFCSFTFGLDRYQAVLCPPEITAVIPSAEIHAGLNFMGRARLDAMLGAAVNSLFPQRGLDDEFTFQGRIRAPMGAPVLTLSRSVDVQTSVGGTSLTLDRFSLEFAVEDFGEAAPALSFEGSIQTGGFTASVLARLDLASERLGLSLKHRHAPLSSPQQFATSAGVDNLGQYFPGSMANLGGMSLVELAMEMSLSPLSIDAIRLVIATEKPVSIIDGVITVQPLLELQVTAPFDASNRSVYAVLFGQWTLGTTPFNVMLSLPDFEFATTMGAGHSLDMAAVVEKLLPGVDLPQIQLMDLEVNGSFKEQRFDATLDVATDWAFDVAGKAFAVRELNLFVSYAEREVQACCMTGRMTVADLDIDVTAEYFQKIGWVVRGGTRAGEAISFTGLYNKLTQGVSGLGLDLALPQAYFDLGVKDVFVQYEQKAGRISFYASLDHSFAFSDSFSLDTFYIRLAFGDGKIGGRVRVKLIVGGVDVFLEATRPDQGEGLLFSGGTGTGQKIPIGVLIQDLANKFGVGADLPEALQSLVIKDIQVTFNSETKDFSLALETDLDVSGQAVRAEIAIDITRHRDKDGYEKSFRGWIYVGERVFTLQFFSDGPVSGLSAVYRKEGGEVLDLRSFLSSLSPSISVVVPDGLALNLKDILLLRHQDSTGSRWVFAFDVAMKLDLPALPVAGSLPAGQGIRVDNLRFLVASQDVSREIAVRLNRWLPSEVGRIPEQDIGSGVNLTASVAFADNVQLLSLMAAAAAAQTQPQDPNFSTGPSPAEAYELAQKQQAGLSAKAKWFDVKKALGPVAVQRVGLAYQTGNVWLLFDASISLAGLTIGLDGFAAGSPLKEFRPQVRLEGLSLGYSGGGVEISGAFISSNPESGDAVYLGEAVIKTQAFNLCALGAYGKTTQGDPTVFLFALMDYPLGGPAFFYVTGLALGYGYNSRIHLPPVEKVRDFSLVRAVMPDDRRPNPFLKAATPLDNLRAMGKDVEPSQGDQWLAAGVRFTSFKMAESFALLVVKLGSRNEVALLGLTRLAVPAEASTPIAYAEIMLEASFLPDEGRLSVEGRLSPASYVLSGDCRLTGGFAFCTWFKGPHAGDFVVTLGGYHPRFDKIKPAHYPNVPRLAFLWQVDSHLTMKGWAYFALIPSGLMAGGRLEVAWQCGDVKAWYSLEANFWINWEPFHYEADVHIHVGASYRLNLLFTSVTISVHVGADLSLWGPPFAGEVRIDLCVFTITIAFGDSHPNRETIEWARFKQAFLPAEPAGAPLLAATSEVTPTRTVCMIRVEGGLLKDLSREPNSACSWIIHPELFELATQSAIPSKSATFNDAEVAGGAWRKDIGIRPMGIRRDDDFTSHHRVSLRRRNPSTGNYEPVRDLTLQPILSGAPKALWGDDGLPADGSSNADLVIENVLSGFHFTPRVRAPLLLKDMELEPLLYEHNDALSLALDVSPALRPNPFQSRIDEENLWFTPADGVSVENTGYILSDLVRPAAVAARERIVACLREQGLALPPDLDLSSAVTGDEAVLQDWPLPAPIDEEALA